MERRSRTKRGREAGRKVALLSGVFAWVGRWLLALCGATGGLALVLARTVRQLPKLDRRELLRGLAVYGYGSLPLMVVVATLTGATVVLQTGLYVERFGARGFLGWAAGYAVLWEFGPLLLGLLMAARIGARNAAELASLSVGGQLEGLRGIALDPYALLVAPRVVATAISLTALAGQAFLIAILFEAVTAFATLDLPIRVFFASFTGMVGWGAFVGGLVKTLCFGLAIALISTAAGMRAHGGAQGVGRAAAASVVYSALAIFSLDFLLTPALTALFT